MDLKARFFINEATKDRRVLIQIVEGKEPSDSDTCFVFKFMAEGKPFSVKNWSSGISKTISHWNMVEYEPTNEETDVLANCCALAIQHLKVSIELLDMIGEAKYK